MEIDGDTGRYGSMLILSKLDPEPQKAVDEIIDSIQIAVERWEEWLDTDDIDTIDEIQQIQEFSLQIDMAGVVNPDHIITLLSNYHIGEYQSTFLFKGEREEIPFKADLFLALDHIEEEEDDNYEVEDDEEPRTHKVAKFDVRIVTK